MLNNFCINNFAIKFEKKFYIPIRTKIVINFQYKKTKLERENKQAISRQPERNHFEIHCTNYNS